MAQYIDKNALVAEIERLIERAKAERVLYPNTILSAKDLLLLQDYNSLKNFINTLEVKEVDLEKEIELVKGDYEQVNVAWNNDFDFIAKHFFELGLNTQQNISINVTDIDKVIEENGVDPNSKEAKMFKESYYMALEKLKAQKGE